MSDSEQIEEILQEANAVGLRREVNDIAIYFNNRFREYTLLQSYQMAYSAIVVTKQYNNE